MPQFDPFARATRLAIAALLLGAASFSLPLAADEPPVAAPRLSEQRRRELLAERDSLWKEAQKLDATGEVADAIILGGTVVRIERSIYGKAHLDLAMSLDWLAARHERQEDFAAAQKLRSEVLEMRTALLGAEHWQVTDARIALAHTNTLANLTPDDRKQLAESAKLQAEAERLSSQNQDAQGIPLAEKAVAICRHVLGKTHRLYAEALSWQGWLNRRAGHLTEAEPLCRETLAVVKAVLGAGHPDTAQCESTLGYLYGEMGRYAEGEALLLQAFKTRQATLGENHPLGAVTLVDLADLYRRQGNLKAAIARSEQAREIRRQSLGEKHPAYANILTQLGGLQFDAANYHAAEALFEQALQSHAAAGNTNNVDYANTVFRLAELYEGQGQHDRAEKLYLDARRIYAQTLGETSSSYAVALGGLAKVQSNRGQYAEALKLRRQASQITGQTEGKQSQNYVVSLMNLGDAHEKLGDYNQAEKTYQQALAAAPAAFGTEHPEYALLLAKVGWIHFVRGEYSKVQPLYFQAAEITKRVRGSEHPDYGDRLNDLAYLHEALGQYAKAEAFYLESIPIYERAHGKDHLNCAAPVGNLGFLYKSLARFSEAEPLLVRALEIREKTFGKDHPETATALSSLGSLYKDLDDFDKAQQYYDRALAIQAKVFGPEHHEYADELHHQALLAQSRGDYDRAEKQYRQALAIYKAQLGEETPAYLQSLGNLANLHLERAEYPQAEALLLRVLEIEKRRLGDNHPSYASSLHSLSCVYINIFDFAKAEPLKVRVLEIKRRAYGDKHPETAQALDQLGQMYCDLDEFARAEPLLKEAVQIDKAAYGPDSLSVALKCHNLGTLYVHMNDPARAEPWLREALEIKLRKLGEQNRETAKTQSLLSCVHAMRGDFEKAAALDRQILEVRRQTLPPEHPEIAESLSGLARIAHQQRDYVKAKPLMEEAMDLRLRNLELAADVQTERQQLDMSRRLRFTLDEYLTLPRTDGDDEACYRQVLRWKSLVSARQRLAHAAADSPELKPVLTELQDVSTQLARLAFSNPPAGESDAWKGKIAELSERRDGLQRKLGAQSAQFRQSGGQIQIADLQAALPAGVALVDCVLYFHNSRGDKPLEKVTWEARLAAFVLTRDLAVKRVDLGPDDPRAKAAYQWREGFGAGAQADAAGKLLREQFWLPIATKIGGAKTVVISPDGYLNWFPLAALPGDKAGSYLLEEYAIGLVPSAQALLAAAPQSANDRSRLLLVGGVDYGKQAAPDYALAAATPATQVAVRGDSARDFSHLPGTVQEVSAIEQSYGSFVGGEKVTKLAGQWASEPTFRFHAPHYRYLHIATHGFFAPPSLHSALDRSAGDAEHQQYQFATDQSLAGYNPNLLSGIVLAGANQPGGHADDGILTAEEVGSLDLRRADLVVLSACETGLGRFAAGGEGVLGLQRAFQIAGARSTITSLWKVDDTATQTLMGEFYRNLWERKLGKLEALRQAQLTMLRRYAPADRKLRGLDAVEGPNKSRPTGSSPFYWAAFVLSGNWQ